MFGTAYYPITFTKGQSADIYFTLGVANNPYGAIEASGAFEYVGISKDGGTFDATTNSPVEIQYDTADGGSGSRSYGRYKLTLTATEMDADVISICWFDSGTGRVGGTLFIFTGSGHPASEGGSGMALTDTVTDVTALADDNPTIREILSLLWQILRKAEKRDRKTLKQILKSGI